jgi:hypothetical protein
MKNIEKRMDTRMTISKMLIPKDVYLLGREKERGNFIITIVFVERLLSCNLICEF